MTPPSGPPQAALSVLGPGESALIFTWARLQKFGTRYGTFYPVGVVIQGVDMVRNHRHLAKVKAASLRFGFPLDRTMAMLVTTDRLVIWKATRHPRRIGDLLGDVPRARIVSATVPARNFGPWTTVRLSVGRWSPQFQVQSDISGEFVDSLGTGPHFSSSS
jgi:hypothetical protein